MLWTMSSWSDVTRAAPDLAEAVQRRFDATGLGLLATLRKDGSPRISGIEPLFTSELWLGMMDASLKAADLRRDPRLALHSATADKNVAEGDAKVAGVAHEVDDAETMARFGAEFKAATGYDPTDGPFHLFRVDVGEISFLRPGGDHLVIEWWQEGTEPQRIERR